VDNVRIFVESSFPERIAQHRDGMCARCAIVVLGKKPSGPWTNSEHFEKVSTDELAENTFRLIAIGDVHLRATARDHTRERGIAIAQVLIHGIRERAV